MGQSCLIPRVILSLWDVPCNSDIELLMSLHSILTKDMKLLLKENKIWNCVKCFSKNQKQNVTIILNPFMINVVSGYYRNLGSLRAGTRHHGETLRYGNSFPPTFSEVLLAHASLTDWPIVAKHANMPSSRGSINAEPATITSESDTERHFI